MDGTGVYEIVTPHVGGGIYIVMWIAIGIIMFATGVFCGYKAYNPNGKKSWIYIGYPLGMLLPIFSIIIAGAGASQVSYDVDAAVDKNIEQQIEEELGLTDIAPVNGIDFKDSFIAKDNNGNTVKGQVVELDESNHYQIRLSEY